MIAIPPAIADQFDPFLTRKSLPHTVRFFYTKWLRFYWDFCHKYHHASFHSDSLPLFLKKLQDKHPSEPQPKQAHHAVSLFYEMQTAPVRNPVNTETTSGDSLVTNDPIKTTSSQPLPDKSQHKLTVSGFNDASRDNASSRVVPNPAKANSSPVKIGAS